MKGPKKFTGIALLAILFTVSTHADPREIPFQLHDHLIVVEGSANGVEGLNLVIDTGATYSMISSTLCRKLNLPTEKTRTISWGKKIDLKTASLEALSIGEIRFLDVEVRVGDLDFTPDLRVDLLIGLNLLKQHNLTINYEKRTLLFDSTRELANRTPFYPDLPFVLIRLQIQDKPMILILDTGAPRLVFFEEKVENKVEMIRTSERERLAHVGGRVTLRKVMLSQVRLGEADLGTTTAYLMNSSSSHYGGAAGIFSPTSLGLKCLHLDFTSKQISWEL